MTSRRLRFLCLALRMCAGPPVPRATGHGLSLTYSSGVAPRRAIYYDRPHLPMFVNHHSSHHRLSKHSTEMTYIIKEKRHRIYVRLHKRMQEAIPLSFPFHISLLLCKKTPDDTRSAVTFYLTNAPSALFPVDEHYRGQWRVEQHLCNPRDEADVLAMILVQKLSAEHDIRHYEDLIAHAVEQTPLLQNVDKYDCAVWTWDVLNRLHAMGAPFDTIPHILGTTTSQLEQHMVDAAMESAMQQQQQHMAAIMATRDDAPIDAVREGKLRKMLPGIKRRGTNTSFDSMETLVNHAGEDELAKKQRKRESFQQLQLAEKDFRNRVDERKPGPRKGWHDHWFHNAVGLISPSL